MGSPVRRGGRPRKVVDTHYAKQLRQEGLSFRKIAKVLALGEGTVRRALSSPMR
jgi:DNA-directed RNA polymerase specialized sigma24 family protein